MAVYFNRSLAKRLAIPLLAIPIACVGPIGADNHSARAQESTQRDSGQQQADDLKQESNQTRQQDPKQQDPRQQQPNQNTRTRPQNSGQQAGQQNQATDAVDPHAEDESPALGVVVGSCPGDAVCVLDTIWGSPADEAGLRQGDYILSVNAQRVTSPLELNQMLEKLGNEQDLTLIVWRNGMQEQKTVRAASMGQEEPPSHKAWLGVKLRPTTDKGVEVQQVVRNSPASDAGLQSGDRIVKVGDKDVTDAKSFVECVEDKGPNDEMQLTIARGDNVQQLTVTLGSLDEAPMQFLRQASRPIESQPFQSQSYDSNDSDEVLEATLDEMRQQIRELRQQVEELTSGQQPAEKDDDLSYLPTVGENEETLVVQRDYSRRYSNRGRSWNNNNNYDWRNQYRSGYRSPLYQSPRYGNSYYRYGGQPYYRNYGNRGYGFGRSGLQFGNLGITWY